MDAPGLFVRQSRAQPTIEIVSPSETAMGVLVTVTRRSPTKTTKPYVRPASAACGLTRRAWSRTTPAGSGWGRMNIASTSSTTAITTRSEGTRLRADRNITRLSYALYAVPPFGAREIYALAASMSLGRLGAEDPPVPDRARRRCIAAAAAVGLRHFRPGQFSGAAVIPVA